ncbi:hypothetical protein TDMWS_06940 [Thermodesulfomicrobium sp. WS]|uniref:hypothetical protein n=1 Tax=Thermodesulfomicrobium sp. WS TaxID=3004129 RepID=UPI0024939A35|nr:hypothetical protein [Thermodesulfomicrobium sp. WS]BDV00609.1 hypothetical protein TDMWS_06940 [Thermodesulfomicrobium sp. WS]
MDASRLIPQALAVPVEPGWFVVLQFVTLVVHFLFMNLMLGGSLIAVAVSLARGGAPAPATETLATKLPFTIAFAVNFGVAPLLFTQVLYGQFLYTSSVLMAVPWISVIALVILAYLAAYLVDFRYHELGGARTAVFAFMAACLATVAFIYTNNMTLMLAPARWQAYFHNPHGTILNLEDPTLAPRYLHFVLASVAVAGLGLAWAAHRGWLSAQWVSHGLTWYAGASMGQYATGMWFYSALPQHVAHAIGGGTMLPTLTFALGAILGLVSIATALQKRLATTTGLLLTTVILMVALRDMIRDLYLEPYFSVYQRTVTHEYGSLIMFLATFIVGIGVIVWMIRAVIADGHKEVRS